MKARLGEWSHRLAFAVLCGVLASCGGHAAVPITQGPDAGNQHEDASLPPQDARADANRSPDGGCGSSLIACGGACIDPMTNTANCGECGNICGLGLICAQGGCGCPPGLTFCGGQCVDALSDANNCGKCGNTCGGVIPCGAGVCGCGAPTKLCGTVCANENSDDQHCGSCTNACAAGQSCTDGLCGCSAPEMLCMPPGGTDGTCTDVQNDPQNCGACNKACSAGEACTAGTCGCAVGQTNCGGITGCVNLGNDPDHCGSTCPGSICVAPLICQNATCGCAVATETYCRATNTCSDLETDPANCGACGTSCNGGACVNGACPIGCAAPPIGTCAPPLTCQSNGSCECAAATPDFCSASNTCVDLLTDPANCGSCGSSCGTGTCNTGTCMSTSSCTLANNAACTPGATSPCCATPTAGISCATVETAFGTYDTGSTFANLCCIASGDPCDTLSNGTCCGYMVCNGTTCACQPAGHHCANDADCCTGVCTTAHICDQTCVLSGVSCELDDKCCNAGTTTPGEACPTTNVCP